MVVGSGGGSMCAALVLRKAGSRVLILEKSGLIGGTTAISGGIMWIPSNRFMKSESIPDGREQAIAYLDAVDKARCIGQESALQDYRPRFARQADREA